MRSLGFVVLLGLGYGFVSSVTPRHAWDKLILTHHWPQTFCGMEHCQSNLNYWTLHGLWPNSGIACNSSWNFNETEIEDLKTEMDKYWPDLKNPESTWFWKYEWHKHGTCAATSESLNSQHKYFSKALELYHKLDLDGMLKKSNIVPSEHYYSLDDIEKAIAGFTGATPKIQCAHSEKNQKLGQIEICFNRDFQLMDCEKSAEVLRYPAGVLTGFSVCDGKTPIYYPPLTEG
ncbi:ribonuclease T2 [Denticeps clupeoides]|uniref:Uncharacterized protein n=1 Tax=Denticeps clupeoides TaxID=299321 RepID=A0AAY4E0F4_9TELE|nr:ribonuclease T2-like [Denticeps clupeoides]XP_028843951.1 ribonuclease T2-like [Denticeps clupeoides]